MKIRNVKHLEKSLLRIPSPVYPDVEETQAWYRLFNRIIFDGALPKLPHIDIQVKTFRGQHAECVLYYCSDCPGNCKYFFCEKATIGLALTTKFPNMRIYLEVLVHEMIHAFQLLHEGKFSHGPTLFQWRDRLAQYHLGISTAY